MPNEKKPVIVVRVAVPVPLRQTFDYLWPEDLPDPVTGARVKVPFGKRTLIGVVVEAAIETGIAKSKLKCVVGQLDSTSVFSGSLALLLNWMADYYHHPIGEVLHAALPANLRQGRSIKPATKPSYSLTPAGWQTDPLTLVRAPRQRSLLAFIQSQSEQNVSAEAIRNQLGNWRVAMKSLLKKGLVRCVEDELRPSETPVINKAPRLNKAQFNGAENVIQRLGEFCVFVLHGITGSGKTEVYLKIAKEVLALKKQVLVLVPEIALTPQLVDRFRNRLGGTLMVMHSAMSDRERHQAWWLAREGHAGVVLGTRSALFCNLKNPGVIIVDEEHDTSFKQQDGCRYHARDAAVKWASLENIPIVLGSATPSLETIENTRQGRYQILRLPQRAGVARLPRIGLVDTVDQTLTNGLSAPLLQSIKQRLDSNEQSIVFINRRGFAPMVVCYRCDWQAVCSRCDAKLTLHRSTNRLRCHHCGSEHKAPVQCPECTNDKLYFAGAGTQRVEQALQKHFPLARILRLDTDVTAARGELESVLEKMSNREADILVGTQMLSKGHDFPNVTLVGIINIDQSLFSMDFRGVERLFQQVTQVAGRAGRAEKSGEVLIQTSYTTNPYFKLIQQHDFDTFAERVLKERKLANYPPFSHLVLLRAESVRQGDAIHFLNIVRQKSLRFLPGGNLVLMDAIPSPMEKRAGRFRAQLMMQSNNRKSLHQFLHRLIEVVETEKTSRRVRWSVDVDPV